jgi:hypothetical protein
LKNYLLNHCSIVNFEISFFYEIMLMSNFEEI